MMEGEGELGVEVDVRATWLERDGKRQKVVVRELLDGFIVV